jgi:hypothetical protein
MTNRFILDSKIGYRLDLIKKADPRHEHLKDALDLLRKHKNINRKELESRLVLRPY